jgi:putative DNA primase/helicase
MGAVYRYALESIRTIRQEAVQAKNTEVRDTLWAHAKRSESRPSLESMVSLAQKIEPIPLSQEQLDRDPWLLNCPNGTVDLRTGNLRRHLREDFITRITPYEIAPAEAKPARWLKFLAEIFAGDQELIDFLQRLLGYALVGEQIEHIFVIFWGTGANGKTTMVDALVDVLGEYAKVLGQEYLMHSKHVRHSTEVMDLYQVRLAVSAETEEGARLSESRVKHQTGGGIITGRRLFEESWSFWPSHTFILETNHKPRIIGNDHGIWRRVLLVPFTVRIPEVDRDVHLLDKLKSEAPAILRWLVDGCIAWQLVGLNPPARVVAATEQYREESDLLAMFVTECCELGPNHKVRGTSLYGAYALRAKSRGEFPLSASRVEDRLEQMKIEKRHTKTGKFYFGIRLKSDCDPDLNPEEFS